MYAKKLITINILRALQRHSDAAHPISQKEIIKYLEDEYKYNNSSCETKEECSLSQPTLP